MSTHILERVGRGGARRPWGLAGQHRALPGGQDRALPCGRDRALPHHGGGCSVGGHCRLEGVVGLQIRVHATIQHAK